MAILIIIGTDASNRLNLDLAALSPNIDANLNPFGVAKEPTGCTGSSSACKPTRRYLVGVPIGLQGGLTAFRVNDANIKPAELYVIQFTETTTNGVTTSSIDNAHAFVLSLDAAKLVGKVVLVVDPAFDDQSI